MEIEYIESKLIYKLKNILAQSITIKIVCLFVPLGILIVAIANIGNSCLGLPQYGDGLLMPYLLANPDEFSAAKYLIGAEFIRCIYSAVWKFPPFSTVIPKIFDGWIGCLKLLGALSMFSSAIYMLSKEYDRISILIIITSPCWILFSTGYLEYYPMVAGVYCIALCWLAAVPLNERPPHQIAFWVSSLPLLYLGFAPIALIILLTYCLGNWHRTVVTFTYTIATFIFLLSIFWAEPLHTFFKKLYAEMNFGDKNTIYKPYLEYSAGENSIFLSLGYAISLKHLLSLGRLLFIGTGMAPLLSLIILGIKKIRIENITLIFRSRDHWLIFSLLLWSTAYLILMLPKYGPEKDFDLYFISYLTFTFYSGKVIKYYPKWKKQLFFVFLVSSFYSLTLMA